MTERLKLSNADKATIIFFHETLGMSQRDVATAMMTSRTSVQRVLKDGAYSPEIEKELVKLRAPYSAIVRLTSDRIRLASDRIYSNFYY